MSSITIITFRKIKQGSFDIIHDISENVTLFQLMESVGNVNHEVIVVKYLIFDSNYKKEIPLTLESLILICYPLEG